MNVIEPGELAGPSSPEPAVTMASTESTQVRAFVEELDAPHVQIGMQASVTVDGLAGREFIGRVVRLSPHMSHKQLWTDRPEERLDTKVREVWIELDEGADLVLGLRVDAIITPPPATPPQAVH